MGFIVLQNQNRKRKIAFIVEHCPIKGLYPFERVITLNRLLQEDESTFVFVKTTSSLILQMFERAGVSPILFDKHDELVKTIRNLELDLIIRDGKDTLPEQVSLIRPFCKTIVHFDDFGDGNTLIDCNILALFDEAREQMPMHALAGSYAFAVSDELKAIAESRVDLPENELPHIVVAFEDGDEQNLTYRTLRHLTQLQIPLKISVAIDAEYRHSVEDLQLMVLSRRNTSIVKSEQALQSLMPVADIVICNNNYTPYKIAAVGIPCITLAQNEHELAHAFARELNGFIHLGVGRKMKQSSIQNAVMELLLHEARRERAIRKQRSLEIIHNNEILQSLLTDLAHGRHNIAHI